MGKVGKFIDAVCETHPQLMRAVLERPLAPLGDWVDWDNANGPCGCLIGTVALAAGYRRSQQIEVFVPGFVADVIGTWTWREIDDVGMQVYRVSLRVAEGPRWRHEDAMSTLASDARTVHLMRQRIARQLAVAESRLPLGSSLPNEPREPSVHAQALGGGRV